MFITSDKNSTSLKTTSTKVPSLVVSLVGSATIHLLVYITVCLPRPVHSYGTCLQMFNPFPTICLETGM